MNTIRKGGWIASQRSKLSASRGPHKSNPKDFYHDAESATERLAGAGPIPDVLTLETEEARYGYLAGYEGISWRGGGRNFTKEYWNPLVGLWVDRGGLDLVFELLVPDPQDFWASRFVSDGLSSIDPWLGVRRYLFAATAEDYAAARARFEPIFEERIALEGGARKLDPINEVLAFAFSREDTGWADRCLERVIEGASSVQYEALLGASTDMELSKRALEARNKYLNLYYVFDMVESHGGAAAELFDLIDPYDARAKKRLAQAGKVAAKVAAL